MQVIKEITGTHGGRVWLLGLWLFLLAWVGASWISHFLVSIGLGYWLELFNGATWPSQFVITDASKNATPILSLWFYIILGFRTVLNLGIILTGLFVFYLLSTGQLKEWFMSKVASVLSTRDTAFAAFLIHKMKEMNIELTNEQREHLFDAADKFQASEAGRTFLKSTVQAATEGQHTTRK